MGSLAQTTHSLARRVARRRCQGVGSASSRATRQGQLALAIDLRQARKGEAPEASREDTDGQEEVGATRHPTCTIRRYPTGGQDTMEMGVMVELLAPGVEHGEAADLSPEMLWVPSDVLERLGDRAKE
jgi:hypothetical protein